MTHNWTDAVIQQCRDITPTVREFNIYPVDGVRSHAPGSHVQVQVRINGAPQTRSYSLVGQPDGMGYRIAVKRLPQGRGGSLAMWGLAVGDRLRVSEPQNHFLLDLSAPAYLLVAGGIGVTPLVWMAQTLARRGVPVRMLLGARSSSEMAYADVLRDILGPQLQLRVTGQDPQIDFAAEMAALPPQAQVYLCGPAPMLDAARRAWAQTGRPVADMRFETFASSGRLAPQAFQLTLPRHSVAVIVSADESLLDAIEMHGVQAMYGCRRGECGLCAMDVLALDGEIDHRDVFFSDTEKAQNQRICICVSRVVGAITLDSAYRPDAI